MTVSKSNSLVRASLACLALVSAPVGFVACGGDDTVGPGADAGKADASSGPDGALDATSSDATPDAGSIVQIQILAFNDFHGNLRPPSPSNAIVIAPPGDPAINDAGSPIATDAGTFGGSVNVQLFAGGASYFATHVKALKQQNPNTLLVSAGDLTGASPLASNAFDDEPTIQVMNVMGLDFNSVGNHEFDKGPTELLRLQNGGCNDTDHVLLDAGNGDGGSIVTGSCESDPTFPGAAFSYLAANVDVSTSPKKTIFPPYVVKSIGGAKIAFIGMTLQATPSIVVPAGTAGLTFDDEITTVNALVPVLKQQGVDSIVVLVHQGGFQAGTYNDCLVFTSGAVAPGTNDIATITDGLDPAVDVVASAHTHAAYNCTRPNGRLLTSAASYGRIITQINLTVDISKHLVTDKSATNRVVTRDVTPDPAVEALVQRYASEIAPIAERKVGVISGDLLRNTGPNGESPLGDVAADAIRTLTGADVAFTNIGGLRDSLLYKQYYSEGDGVVTFEKAQSVMPFKNKVELLTCTGAQIIAALQQNVYVQAGGVTKLLQVSNGLTFSWDASLANADGQNAAVPSSFMLNGAAIDTAKVYKVGRTDFVATGGDGYTGFRACTVSSVLGIDLDALTTYLGANEPLATPPANRITKL